MYPAGWMNSYFFIGYVSGNTWLRSKSIALTRRYNRPHPAKIWLRINYSIVISNRGNITVSIPVIGALYLADLLPQDKRLLLWALPRWPFLPSCLYSLKPDLWELPCIMPGTLVVSSPSTAIVIVKFLMVPCPAHRQTAVLVSINKTAIIFRDQGGIQNTARHHITPLGSNIKPVLIQSYPLKCWRFFGSCCRPQGRIPPPSHQSAPDCRRRWAAHLYKVLLAHMLYYSATALILPQLPTVIPGRTASARRWWSFELFSRVL